MKRLIASTALMSTLLAPAALAATNITANVDALPESYTTADLNRIVLQQVEALPEPTTVITYTDTTNAMPADDMTTTTIVDVAAGDERFSTLVSLIKEAGLVDALSAEGPFTVFAPTNDAFAELPAETVDYLTSEEGKDDLKAILKSHVTMGEFRSSDLPMNGVTVNALSDRNLDIEVMDGNVSVEGSDVIVADIVTDNGVIHAIDQVILPKDKS